MDTVRLGLEVVDSLKLLWHFLCCEIGSHPVLDFVSGATLDSDQLVGSLSAHRDIAAIVHISPRIWRANHATYRTVCMAQQVVSVHPSEELLHIISQVIRVSTSRAGGYRRMGYDSSVHARLQPEAPKQQHLLPR